MGLRLISKNYFILTRDKGEKLITEFNAEYIDQLRSEGWRTIDSFNIRQKREIRQ